MACEPACSMIFVFNRASFLCCHSFSLLSHEDVIGCRATITSAIPPIIHMFKMNVDVESTFISKVDFMFGV